MEDSQPEIQNDIPQNLSRNSSHLSHNQLSSEKRGALTEDQYSNGGRALNDSQQKIKSAASVIGSDNGDSSKEKPVEMRQANSSSKQQSLPQKASASKQGKPQAEKESQVSKSSNKKTSQAQQYQSRQNPHTKEASHHSTLQSTETIDLQQIRKQAFQKYQADKLELQQQAQKTGATKRQAVDSSSNTVNYKKPIQNNQIQSAYHSTGAQVKPRHSLASSQIASNSNSAVKEQLSKTQEQLRQRQTSNDSVQRQLRQNTDTPSKNMDLPRQRILTPTSAGKNLSSHMFKSTLPRNLEENRSNSPHSPQVTQQMIYGQRKTYQDSLKNHYQGINVYKNSRRDNSQGSEQRARHNFQAPASSSQNHQKMQIDEPINIDFPNKIHHPEEVKVLNGIEGGGQATDFYHKQYEHQDFTDQLIELNIPLQMSPKQVEEMKARDEQLRQEQVRASIMIALDEYNDDEPSPSNKEGTEVQNHIQISPSQQQLNDYLREEVLVQEQLQNQSSQSRGDQDEGLEKSSGAQDQQNSVMMKEQQQQKMQQLDQTSVLQVENMEGISIKYEEEKNIFNTSGDKRSHQVSTVMNEEEKVNKILQSLQEGLYNSQNEEGEEEDINQDTLQDYGQSQAAEEQIPQENLLEQLNIKANDTQNQSQLQGNGDIDSHSQINNLSSILHDGENHNDLTNVQADLKYLQSDIAQEDQLIMIPNSQKFMNIITSGHQSFEADNDESLKQSYLKGSPQANIEDQRLSKHVQSQQADQIEYGTQSSRSSHSQGKNSQHQISQFEKEQVRLQQSQVESEGNNELHYQSFTNDDEDPRPRPMSILDNRFGSKSRQVAEMQLAPQLSAAQSMKKMETIPTEERQDTLNRSQEAALQLVEAEEKDEIFNYLPQANSDLKTQEYHGEEGQPQVEDVSTSRVDQWILQSPNHVEKNSPNSSSTKVGGAAHREQIQVFDPTLIRQDQEQEQSRQVEISIEQESRNDGQDLSQRIETQDSHISTAQVVDTSVNENFMQVPRQDVFKVKKRSHQQSQSSYLKESASKQSLNRPQEQSRVLESQMFDHSSPIQDRKQEFQSPADDGPIDDQKVQAMKVGSLIDLTTAVQQQQQQQQPQRQIPQSSIELVGNPDHKKSILSSDFKSTDTYPFDERQISKVQPATTTKNFEEWKLLNEMSSSKPKPQKTFSGSPTQLKQLGVLKPVDKELISLISKFINDKVELGGVEKTDFMGDLQHYIRHYDQMSPTKYQSSKLRKAPNHDHSSQLGQKEWSVYGDKYSSAAKKGNSTISRAQSRQRNETLGGEDRQFSSTYLRKAFNQGAPFEYQNVNSTSTKYQSPAHRPASRASRQYSMGSIDRASRASLNASAAHLQRSSSRKATFGHQKDSIGGSSIDYGRTSTGFSSKLGMSMRQQVQSQLGLSASKTTSKQFISFNKQASSSKKDPLPFKKADSIQNSQNLDKAIDEVTLKRKIYETREEYDTALEEMNQFIIDNFRNTHHPSSDELNVGAAFVLLLSIADINIQLTNDRGNLCNKDWEYLKKYLKSSQILSFLRILQDRIYQHQFKKVFVSNLGKYLKNINPLKIKQPITSVVFNFCDKALALCKVALLIKRAKLRGYEIIGLNADLSEPYYPYRHNQQQLDNQSNYQLSQQNTLQDEDMPSYHQGSKTRNGTIVIQSSQTLSNRDDQPPTYQIKITPNQSETALNQSLSRKSVKQDPATTLPQIQELGEQSNRNYEDDQSPALNLLTPANLMGTGARSNQQSQLNLNASSALSRSPSKGGNNSSKLKEDKSYDGFKHIPKNKMDITLKMTQFIQERSVKPEEEPSELNDSKILVVQSKRLV